MCKTFPPTPSPRNCRITGELVELLALRKRGCWLEMGWLCNLFLPLSSTAPLTGDPGPLDVQLSWPVSAWGVWESRRGPRQAPALLSASFLTTAKYTGPFVPHRTQKYAGSDIKRVLSDFLPVAFSATDALPAWQRAPLSWTTWSIRKQGTAWIWLRDAKNEQQI